MLMTNKIIKKNTFQRVIPCNNNPIQSYPHALSYTKIRCSAKSFISIIVHQLLDQKSTQQIAWHKTVQ